MCRNIMSGIGEGERTSSVKCGVWFLVTKSIDLSGEIAV
jgi:hypothetical protein